MKSFYTVPVIALIASSLSRTTTAEIPHGDSAKVDIPDLAHAQSNGRIGIASYDKNGRILIPRDTSSDLGEVMYDSDGRIVGIKQAAASQDGGGVAYNSDGGIVLPNQHFAAADTDNKGCGSVNCMPMPYRMGYVDDGDTSSEKLNVITYNSEGGIVLPNSVAKQPGGTGEMIPMPFSRGSKVAVNQEQTNGNAGTPQDGQYKQGHGYFYDLEGHRGSCGKNAKNTDMVAALSATVMGTDQGSSNENCGKHLEVVGPNGETVEVEIVDYCNTCGEGDLDLSPAAYERIAQLNSFNTTIKWRFI